MKQNVILILAFLTVVLISPVAFAVGGPAVEIQKEETAVVQSQTAEAQPVAVTKEAAAAELEKAKEELTSLEVQREMFVSYLVILNRKIIEAKMAGNTKKLSELQAMERAMSDQENKVAWKILTIKQEQPELKPAEKPEMEVSEKEEKPEEAEKPKAVSRNIDKGAIKQEEETRKIKKAPNYYKVQVGLFTYKEEAVNLKNSLKEKGYDCFIKTIGEKWRVQAGAFKNKNFADKLVESLKTDGFNPEIIYE